ncbi:StbA family protein [Sulfobacillus acidophilus DSM 10332]|uniref:StbA family protein n=1 Tax=Sulfobacillus acidophilus (strain ATCC 700253 / DSM 10332 / NAL) TaxID=679936 RepID=G8TVK5_SULAD|nr:StbA family protein [Sulfobacillus acidophilus DSM 10332]
MSKLFVGVDFGTTNSTIAFVQPNGRISTNGPVPSLVAWENHQIVALGQKARDLTQRGSPPYPLRDLKMHLDSGIVRLGTTAVDVVDIISRYLKSLFSNAGYGTTDVQVVAGTPVRVSRKHRENLREAFRRAGIPSVQLIYEPTAALLGAMRNISQLISETVLVVDWGGGTLDLALIRIDEDHGFRELGVDGDVNDLGGSQMDHEIVRQLLQKSAAAKKAVESIPSGYAILLETIERLKVYFLEDPEASRQLVSGLPVQVYLDSDLVMSVIQNFARRARTAVENMLAKMQINPTDITKIFFAGGVSQSSVVRDEIMALFPDAEEIHDDNPQLSTGIGCAKLAQTPFSLELAADFAVRQSDDSSFVLLKKGQSVSQNRYRQVDFMVTDVTADEAVFDFGLHHRTPGATSMWSVDSEGFQSVRQTFIRVGQPELPRAKNIPDIVHVFTGLDENLSVAVYLKAQRSEASVQDFITGIPLTVRLGEPQ